MGHIPIAKGGSHGLDIGERGLRFVKLPDDENESIIATAASVGPAVPGAVAAAAAVVLDSTSVVVIAFSEQRADAIAGALRALVPGIDVRLLPPNDALPGDATAPSLANAGARVAALRAVRQAIEAGERVALVTTAEAAARVYPAPSAYDIATLDLAVGAVVDPEDIGERLHALGYEDDDRVDEPGEMAAHGQTIDIYPADRELPVRVEIVDDLVAALRAYDPITQLSSDELDAVTIAPVVEPEAGSGGVAVFDHMPGATVVLDPDVEGRRERFEALVVDALKGQPDDGRARVVTKAAWAKALAGRTTVTPVANTVDIPRFIENKAPIRAFARFARERFDAGQSVLVAGAARDLRFLRRHVARALTGEPVTVASWAEVAALEPGRVAMLEAPVDRGWQGVAVAVVAAADLLGSRAALASAAAASTGDPLREATAELMLGDVVVHEDHGIGVIAGLESVASAVTGSSAEAVVIEYAGDNRRLVPVAEAGKIWRYGGERDAVTLDKLDGSSWAKRRAEVNASIEASATELARLAVEREQLTAPAIAPDAALYERFSAGFPFDETADQARAIAAVRHDLASGKPMDRLVVGDVGYGKTEVALRAVALVALSGRQAVLTAPTTVLVRQHIDTFTKRFEGTGITVAGLSRLSSAAEKKAAKAGLADGSIKVVIGTGAVAAKGVEYHDLALVVIDEEQRFGAADKAKLRELASARNGAGHVLTLSATPIPRTLQSALVGLQSLSLIATPPAKRQPIRTTMLAFDAQAVRGALMRERSRGGQSFVVVPRIEDMEAMAGELAKAVPELSVVRAHGKMPALEIDEAMVGVGTGRGDILLAANIIEAGLDVPRANCMVVWRADRFGLSQLHQLRGRVGRGGRRGTILLTTDPAAKIADATIKRLRTLEAFDRLGAGFAISARDLDMRGAGDLVGDAQAGHMKLIGVELYQHLLEEGLRRARGEGVTRVQPELHLGVEGALPESWVAEVEIRIGLYCRLARITETAALDAFEAELDDRFGALPDPVLTLFAVARVRLLASSLGLARIDAGPGAIAITPAPDAHAGFAAAGLAHKGDRWLLAERIEDAGERLARVQALLEELGQDA